MARLPKLKNGRGAVTWLRWILPGVLLLLLIFGAIKAKRVWDLVNSLQGRLDVLQAAADGRAELGSIGASLRGAHADLDALQSEAAFLMPVARSLGWVPRVGGDIQAAPALLDLARSVIEAGIIAFDGLEPLVTLIEEHEGNGRLFPQVLGILADARPNLKAAQAHLDVALRHRAQVDDGILSARTANLIKRLDHYLPLMEVAFDGARLLPDLLGASGRQTYLVLAQNNDELRATGGFISAVGHLVLDKGDIVEITFEDSYAVDKFDHPYPDSPPPVLRYMGIDQWIFRDANWSPDYPTAAQKAIELYRLNRNLETDGVLAVDQHALQAVVTALEPLEVKGWPEPVSGENVISLIRLAWSPTELATSTDFDLQWWQQRKRFISDLVDAMETKVETAPGQIKWIALARAVFQILDERHVQIWLTDPTHAAANLLATRGWNGALSQTISDYLLVVDTNMGYNKANAIVEQRLDYRVLVSADGSAQATLAVHHVNRSSGEGSCNPWPHYGADYDDIINRCYWNYLRVYAPNGSQLLAATAHPISGDLLVTRQRQPGAAETLPAENGKAVFGTFLVLPRGQETQTRFVYQLPNGMVERKEGGWCYRLLVQKQAGTKSVPLRIELVLPPGASVQSPEAPTTTQSDSTIRQPEPGTVLLETNLYKDRYFEVLFQFGEH